MESELGVPVDEAAGLLRVGRTRIEQLLSERCPLIVGPDDRELISFQGRPIEGKRPHKRLIDRTSIDNYVRRHERSKNDIRWVHPSRSRLEKTEELNNEKSVGGPKDGARDLFSVAIRLDELLKTRQQERLAQLASINQEIEHHEQTAIALVKAEAEIKRLKAKLGDETKRADEETSARQSLFEDTFQRFGAENTEGLWDGER